MHKIVTLIGLLGIVFSATMSASAAIPTTMTVQGRLADSVGVPAPPGEKKFQFKIFDTELHGHELWPQTADEETQTVITDADGLWTAQIGSVIPLAPGMFGESGAWLEIMVDNKVDSPVVLPRIRLSSSAYAYFSGVSESAGSNSVTTGAIVNGAVRNADLGADAVTTNKILDATILGQDIGADEITGGHIAPNSITGSHIQDGTISTLDIAVGGVVNSDLSGNAVTSDKIVDGTITSADIGTGQVGTSDLTDNAVTSAKIINSGVANEDLANNSVTAAKILNGTIANADISASANISPSKINGTAATLTTSQTFTSAKNFTHNTGMGTTTPGSHKLMVESALSGVSGATVFVKNTSTSGLGMIVEATSSDLPLLISQQGSGDILRCDSYTGGWHPVFRVKNDGYVVASVLELTGGADLAEPFEVSGEDPIEPGMVVAIDRDNPGELRIATRAYDRTVAGIISGANGLNPGLILKQTGSEANGAHPVALSGRVYCQVDAQYGAIQPGDFLTTSKTPGHAMKVSDREASYGSVIGKAMTSLESGRGLVLVLVNLQ